MYTLNKGDKQIFQAAKTDPDIFANWYFKNEFSGTWWMPGAKNERWKVGYDRIHKHWKSEGRPNTFKIGPREYQTIFEHEMSESFPKHPAFFHNHGTLFLPWAKELHNDRTPIRTVVGGFGSGKTLNMALSMLIYAATLPGYRGFAMAPILKQAEEMQRVMLSLIEGTLYEERFLVKAVGGHNPQIIVSNDYVGTTSIEFFSIMTNPEKIRTLTGDNAVIDQAEKIPDLNAVIRDVGSRFRGRYKGRGRLGTITFIANSEENEQLWDIYDKAEEDPRNYKSMSPSSLDNIYLTDRDIERYMLLFGDDEDEREQYIEGKRPVGNGEHFSRDILTAMRDENLDRIMRKGIDQDLDGYTMLQESGVGVYEWLLPPAPGREYLVISDPGTKNPPYRDSPPILVWDITDFPGEKGNRNPVTLAGFVWVFANGSIDNWATRYAEIVYRYDAVGTNAFDATGYQSGYDQWLDAMEGLLAEKINLAGNGKYMALNAAKMITSRRMAKIPYALSSITGQLSRYTTPEPKRLRQDVAIAFMMSCWWLLRLYYFDAEEEDYNENQTHIARNKRYDRSIKGRFPGSTR